MDGESADLGRWAAVCAGGIRPRLRSVGFNYLGEFGKLMEDSWDKDWPRIERDFREMRKLGGNIVRIHLQFRTYMTGPDKFDRRNSNG